MEVTAKAGMRLRSAVCQTEVVVVKGPAEAVDLRCGGRPLAAIDASSGGGGEPLAGFDGGTLVGKRYVDPSGTLELLCTKPGSGSLSLGDAVLEVKSAKPMPSSD